MKKYERYQEKKRELETGRELRGKLKGMENEDFAKIKTISSKIN